MSDYITTPSDDLLPGDPAYGLDPKFYHAFQVPSGIQVRAIDNGCYWECHWTLPDGTWHESTIDDEWPLGVLNGYDEKISSYRPKVKFVIDWRIRTATLIEREPPILFTGTSLIETKLLPATLRTLLYKVFEVCSTPYNPVAASKTLLRLVEDGSITILAHGMS